MLNTNISHQILIVFTNVYMLFCAYDSVWSHLKALDHIISRSKGCLPYQGECVEYYVIRNKNTYLP